MKRKNGERERERERSGGLCLSLANCNLCRTPAVIFKAMSEQTPGEESTYEIGLCQYAQKITACFGGMDKGSMYVVMRAICSLSQGLP